MTFGLQTLRFPDHGRVLPDHGRRHVTRARQQRYHGKAAAVILISAASGTTSGIGIPAVDKDLDKTLVTDRLGEGDLGEGDYQNQTKEPISISDCSGQNLIGSVLNDRCTNGQYQCVYLLDPFGLVKPFSCGKCGDSLNSQTETEKNPSSVTNIHTEKNPISANIDTFTPKGSANIDTWTQQTFEFGHVWGRRLSFLLAPAPKHMSWQCNFMPPWTPSTQQRRANFFGAPWTPSTPSTPHCGPQRGLGPTTPQTSLTTLNGPQRPAFFNLPSTPSTPRNLARSRDYLQQFNVSPKESSIQESLPESLEGDQPGLTSLATLNQVKRPLPGLKLASNKNGMNPNQDGSLNEQSDTPPLPLISPRKIRASRNRKPTANNGNIQSSKAFSPIQPFGGQEKALIPTKPHTTRPNKYNEATSPRRSTVKQVPISSEVVKQEATKSSTEVIKLAPQQDDLDTPGSVSTTPVITLNTESDLFLTDSNCYDSEQETSYPPESRLQDPCKEPEAVRLQEPELSLHPNASPWSMRGHDNFNLVPQPPPGPGPPSEKKSSPSSTCSPRTTSSTCSPRTTRQQSAQRRVTNVCSQKAASDWHVHIVKGAKALSKALIREAAGKTTLPHIRHNIRQASSQCNKSQCNKSISDIKATQTDASTSNSSSNDRAVRFKLAQSPPPRRQSKSLQYPTSDTAREVLHIEAPVDNNPSKDEHEVTPFIPSKDQHDNSDQESNDRIIREWREWHNSRPDVSFSPDIERESDRSPSLSPDKIRRRDHSPDSNNTRRDDSPDGVRDNFPDHIRQDHAPRDLLHPDSDVLERYLLGQDNNSDCLERDHDMDKHELDKHDKRLSTAGATSDHDESPSSPLSSRGVSDPARSPSRSTVGTHADSLSAGVSPNQIRNHSKNANPQSPSPPQTLARSSPRKSHGVFTSRRSSTGQHLVLFKTGTLWKPVRDAYISGQLTESLEKSQTHSEARDSNDSTRDSSDAAKKEEEEKKKEREEQMKRANTFIRQRTMRNRTTSKMSLGDQLDQKVQPLLLVPDTPETPYREGGFSQKRTETETPNSPNSKGETTKGDTSVRRDTRDIDTPGSLQKERQFGQTTVKLNGDENDLNDVKKKGRKSRELPFEDEKEKEAANVLEDAFRKAFVAQIAQTNLDTRDSLRESSSRSRENSSRSSETRAAPGGPGDVPTGAGPSGPTGAQGPATGPGPVIPGQVDTSGKKLHSILDRIVESGWPFYDDSGALVISEFYGLKLEQNSPKKQDQNSSPKKDRKNSRELKKDDDTNAKVFELFHQFQNTHRSAKEAERVFRELVFGPAVIHEANESNEASFNNKESRASDSANEISSPSKLESSPSPLKENLKGVSDSPRRKKIATQEWKAATQEAVLEIYKIIGEKFITERIDTEEQKAPQILQSAPSANPNVVVSAQLNAVAPDRSISRENISGNVARTESVNTTGTQEVSQSMPSQSTTQSQMAITPPKPSQISITPANLDRSWTHSWKQVLDAIETQRCTMDICNFAQKSGWSTIRDHMRREGVFAKDAEIDKKSADFIRERYQKVTQALSM